MAAMPDTYTFSFGERLGLVFISQSAAISACAVSALLLWIVYHALPPIRRVGGHQRWKVSTHIHLYFINLLVSDLIQAIGALLDIRWIIEAKVTEGTLCTVQGIFKQLGDVGVALSSMSIALHTFAVLLFGWNSPPRVALLVIACIWVFLALIVGVALGVHGVNDYYGDTQYWCWISDRYPKHRIGLEYAWLYIAAFLNLIIYVILALVIRGWLVVDGHRIKIQRGSTSHVQYLTGDSERTRTHALAWHMMLWVFCFDPIIRFLGLSSYPIVYCVTVTPIAVVRWLSFDHKQVGFAWTVFAAILFSASGLFNVLLYTFTRPKLLPSRERVDVMSNRVEYWNARERFRRRASVRTSITDLDACSSSQDFSGDGWKGDAETAIRPAFELSRMGPHPPTPVHLRESSPPHDGVRITKEYHIS